LKAPDQKLVGNTLRQRRLRTDNGKVNLTVFGYPDQRLNIGRVDINVMGKLSRAGVTRSDKNLLDLAALGELPDQGMLPAPTTDNQYLYLTYPLSFLNPIPLPLNKGKGEEDLKERLRLSLTLLFTPTL
jgi:hypothetical protein